MLCARQLTQRFPLASGLPATGLTRGLCGTARGILGPERERLQRPSQPADCCPTTHKYLDTREATRRLKEKSSSLQGTAQALVHNHSHFCPKGSCHTNWERVLTLSRASACCCPCFACTAQQVLEAARSNWASCIAREGLLRAQGTAQGRPQDGEALIPASARSSDSAGPHIFIRPADGRALRHVMSAAGCGAGCSGPDDARGSPILQAGACGRRWHRCAAQLACLLACLPALGRPASWALPAQLLTAHAGASQARPPL